MDKILDKQSFKSKVIGLYGGDENTKDHAEPANVDR